MKEITIKVPDNFNIPEGYEVKLVKKDECSSKFKKGDVFVTETGYIGIFEKLGYTKPSTGNLVVYYSVLYSPSINNFIGLNKIDYGVGHECDCRLATDEEREILINALKEKSFESEKAVSILKDVFNIEVKEINTYQDLINNHTEINGYFIGSTSNIVFNNSYASINNKNLATSEQIAKSMLTMAQISQLMPYYGGDNHDMWVYPNNKYVIRRVGDRIISDTTESNYYFLSFHTPEQRDKFLKYNERLVKDYLMIK